MSEDCPGIARAHTASSISGQRRQHPGDIGAQVQPTSSYWWACRLCKNLQLLIGATTRPTAPAGPLHVKLLGNRSEAFPTCTSRITMPAAFDVPMAADQCPIPRAPRDTSGSADTDRRLSSDVGAKEGQGWRMKL
jgi:hypothetical protein